MTWIIGIDEAGYGPNLGPFVMSAVACRAPAPLAGADLWEALQPAVRRREGSKDDGRLLVDDSKVVHTSRGVAGLERGILATLGPALAGPTADLVGLLGELCVDGGDDLRAEAWYRGDSAVPGHVPPKQVADHAAGFTAACAAAGIGGPWLVRSAIVCPPRFNALVDSAGSKGAVLAHGLVSLLRCSQELTAGDEDVYFFIDKHGGRNAYAAQIQHALLGSVVSSQEGLARSVYRVLGLGRAVRLTFQPRADAEHFCVALASMVSKYLREALMGEFNRFWQREVPGLKATAGYPGDAPRFLEAIRPAARRLGIAEEALWRRK